MATGVYPGDAIWGSRQAQEAFGYDSSEFPALGVMYLFISGK